MVGTERLELSRRKTLAPKASASANSATSPYRSAHFSIEARSAQVANLAVCRRAYAAIRQGFWRLRAMVFVAGATAGWCFGGGSSPGKALAGDLKAPACSAVLHPQAFYNLRVITNHQLMVGNLGNLAVL